MAVKLNKYMESVEEKKKIIDQSRPAIIDLNVENAINRGSRPTSLEIKTKNVSPLRIILPPEAWNNPLRRWRVLFYFDLLKDFNTECLNEAFYTPIKKKTMNSS